MKSSNCKTARLSLVLTTLFASNLISSCAGSSIRNSTGSIAQQESSPPMSVPAEAPAYDAGATSQKMAVVANQVSTTTANPATSRPQLVKRAEMAVTVSSIDESIEVVTNIVKQQQGDLLGLQDQKPLNDNSRHTASIEMRVPQQRLENTLEMLAKLGTLKRRTLTAEDVTNQLVDNEARLRNLRNQESALQKIMQRSGSVGDVLKVAQELGNVRQSIEQLDAQLKSLRNQVAYSTINLNLEEAIASTPNQSSLAVQTQDTWSQATHSVGKFTTGLLKLGIWTIAYSPYLLVIAAAIFGYNRYRRHRLPQQRN